MKTAHPRVSPTFAGNPACLGTQARTGTSRLLHAAADSRNWRE
jgi:hypothetical protein